MDFGKFWGGAAAPYEIEQSLRFDGSAYLSRSLSTTANYTMSVWVKFAKESNTDGIIGHRSSSSAYKQIFKEGSGYDSIGSDNTGSTYAYSNNKCRDFSGWYHIVASHGSSVSSKIYINGEEVSYRLQPGSSGGSTSSATYYIGALWNAASPFNGYMAEVQAVESTELPTAFGEYDDNGVWRPIAYSGSYGSSGYYLKFDPTATNGIGHDHSGNGNHFTASGFTTSGTGTDVMSDTPTNNFCTLNPLFQASNLTNGNLQYNRVSPNVPDVGTIALPANQGKWYWEITLNSNNGDDSEWVFGVVKTTLPRATLVGSYAAYQHASNTRRKYGTLDSGPSWTLAIGDVLGIGIDMTNGDFRLYKNGTLISNWTASVDTDFDHYPFINGYWSGDNATMNFGQRAFEYTPPTDHVALCTANLPAPTVKDGSQHFDTKLYTANNQSAQTITGLAFSPDLLWFKTRSRAEHHYLYDQVRGAGNRISSSQTIAEITGDNSLTAFTSDGFSLGADGAGIVNYSTDSMVAWAWDAGGSGSSIAAGSIDGTNPTIASTVSANPTAGFSIVSYTAQNAVRTIGHGLGVVPGLIIVKNRDATQNWAVYHKSLGATKALYLDLDIKQDPGSGYWNNTEPTSTVFTVGTNTRTGGTTNKYVAYCFAEIEGYSKFSTYRGNGSTDGAYCYTGFKPAWVMVKTYAGGSQDSWYIWDNKSDPYNFSYHYLRADANSAQNTDTTNAQIDILSNGFKIRQSSANINENGSDYVFIAFAEHPFGGSGVSPATAR